VGDVSGGAGGYFKICTEIGAHGNIIQVLMIYFSCLVPKFAVA
jgi:hypothetical protein